MPPAVFLLAARLILNEVMIRPATGGAEWIELLNAGDEPAALAGLEIEDARARPAAAPGNLPPLEPGGFWILTADTSKFLAAFPGADARRVTKPGGAWPTFNDADGSDGFADRIRIRATSGAVLDSLEYTARWIGTAGVALERVDPGGATQLASNWSPSVDPSGGTPLARNSLALLPGENLEGALIVPEGPLEDDGGGLRVPIAWHLERPALLSMELFDMRGRTVRLLKPLESSGTVGRIVWDGRDDAGRDVPPGIFWVLLEGRLDGDRDASRWRRPVVVVRRGP